MPPGKNPYNPWVPAKGKMFKNQEIIIKEIDRIIRRAPTQRCSCAIIGGPKMGKTSILIYMKNKLFNELEYPTLDTKPILFPVYVELRSPQDGDDNSLRILFSQVIDEIKKEIMTKCLELHIRWPPGELHLSKNKNTLTTYREDCSDFAADLWSMVKIIEDKLDKVKLVILLDNIHRLMEFKDLRMKLAEAMVELLGHGGSDLDIRPYVSFVLACTEELTSQLPVRRTENLISVIERLSLRLFPKEISLEVIKEPLEERYGISVKSEVADEIHRRIGGHPGLLHLFMFYFCESCPDDFQMIEMIEMLEIQERVDYTTEKDGYIIDEIIKTIQSNPAVEMVFYLLLQSMEPLDLQSILLALPLPEHRRMAHQVRNALQILQYLGVVEFQEDDRKRSLALISEMFKSRFMITSDLRRITISRPELERIIETENSFLDVNQWRVRLGELERQVCRIEIQSNKGMIYGTGFLIASNIVITNYHVMESVIEGVQGNITRRGERAGVDDVILRFDYKRLAYGTSLNSGTIYRLAANDWLIDKSPMSFVDSLPQPKDEVPQPDELDYVLLRVDGTPGFDRIGGKADPNAPLRKWIEVPSQEYDFRPNTALFILQHPQREPLKLAVNSSGLIGLNDNATRVTYRTNTMPGSSGAPCFNVNWELIALHHGGDPNFEPSYKPTYNEGIPFTAILSLLEQRGFRGMLNK